MTANLQPGDRVLVEAVVERIFSDDIVDISVKLDGALGERIHHIWDVPNGLVHFVEPGPTTPRDAAQLGGADESAMSTVESAHSQRPAVGGECG